MPAFSYKALDNRGKTVKGLLEGDSAKHVRVLLRERQLKPIDVVESSAQKSDSSSLLANFTVKKVSSTDIALFTRQLATLLQAGLPLAEALQAVAKQTRKSTIKSVVLQVRAKVTEGYTLGFALAEHPKMFSPLYRAMVKAGEHAGFLGIVLEQLADYTEEHQQSQQKIKMAMLYPAILVMVAITVISALMVLVVPDLVKIFASSKTELPILTRMLIATSDFIVNWGIVCVIALIAIVVGIKFLLKDPRWRFRWHQVVLKLPLLGNLARANNAARFTSTLAILLKSGVPLLEAMRIGVEVCTNLVLQQVVRDAAERVQEGGSLSKALEDSEQFPPMMVHMIASGETSGELESMLERSANNQQRELEMTLGAMLGIMEPLLIVFMGGTVLVIVLAILMPIFELNNMVK